MLGYTADAERLTVEQAKVKYLDDCRSRIGLAEDGIKPGTYQNTDRMLRLALAVTTSDFNWPAKATDRTEGDVGSDHAG